MSLQFLILASLVCATIAQEGCWWSGCQPTTWKDRGCFPQDSLKQIGSRPCNGGDEYHCCPTSGGGSTGGNPSGQAQESGICSWYGAVGEIPEGFVLPSNEVFDRLAMKAAHKTLPFGTKIRVTNSRNGKTVDVTINDRGPFTPGRIVDLTYGAFAVIDNHDVGVVPCSYTVIS